jgi:hypothetical protein
MEDVRSNGWIWTVNNWEAEHVEITKKLDYKYLIIGDEIAPTTGTPHLQCYVYFNNARTWSSMKKKLPFGNNIMKANGNAKSNQTYCSKEKVLFEGGEIPRQGKRNDIEVCRDLVKDGGNMREVTDICTSMQGVRIAEIWLKYHEKPRDWKPDIFWFWGPPGSGKTREAFDMCRDPWVSGKDLKWWEGYDGQGDVIIDDFRCTDCTFSELLHITDRYAFRVENKGGSRQLRAKRIIFTSPFPPEKAFNNTEDKFQLIRRFLEIREFKNDREVFDREVGVIVKPDLNVVILDLLAQEKEKC